MRQESSANSYLPYKWIKIRIHVVFLTQTSLVFFQYLTSLELYLAFQDFDRSGIRQPSCIESGTRMDPDRSLITIPDAKGMIIQRFQLPKL